MHRYWPDSPANDSQGRENGRRKSATADESTGHREVIGGVAQGIEGQGGLTVAEPVGARLAGDGELEGAIAGKPGSYEKRFTANKKRRRCISRRRFKP
jgi:hypothetical protein